jgi:hypothetical protein
MKSPDDFQDAYDQYHALLEKAREYVVYMARENPLREHWQEFDVDDCTMHLDVGVVTLKESAGTRSVYFLLTSLCADWRCELHADLLTSLAQEPIADETDPEYPEYRRLRAKFGVK